MQQCSCERRERGYIPRRSLVIFCAQFVRESEAYRRIGSGPTRPESSAIWGGTSVELSIVSRRPPGGIQLKARHYVWISSTVQTVLTRSFCWVSEKSNHHNAHSFTGRVRPASLVDPTFCSWLGHVSLWSYFILFSLLPSFITKACFVHVFN
jgi:hypothetical protein